MSEGCFIQVIVPLRLGWVPWYRAPRQLMQGTRVMVSFAHRQYSGVVINFSARLPQNLKVQDIIRVQEELPAISAEELRFWEFLADYYLCTIGEVYKAAYPSGKIEGEQKSANILERLRSRLAIREEALTKKHRDNVRERLEAERDTIAAQIEALTRIAPGQNEPKSKNTKPMLLAGPGRTQEYIKLCRSALEQGLNVLVLTPEIAAASQLAELFEESFPGQVHNVNSHISEAKRRRVAEDLRRFGAQLVVGARSALFLPFSRLGLIIIENEQDELFKQSDPAPRYNARDAAVMLGRIHGAAVVLGSPSPSLESYHNAQTGKYILQSAASPLPPISIIDVIAERRKNGMVGVLSRKLIAAISKTSGPVALIRGWEKPDELMEMCLRNFPERTIDIFTAPKAKLADLRKYTIIAILQADALFPDEGFRSDERAVQAIAMLREQCQGSFIVQTAKADHPVFNLGGKIYERLLEERRSFSLPPFTRLIDTDFGGHKERLTLPADSTLVQRKKELRERALAFEKKTGGRIRVHIDVDPIS